MRDSKRSKSLSRSSNYPVLLSQTLSRLSDTGPSEDPSCSVRQQTAIRLLTRGWGGHTRKTGLDRAGYQSSEVRGYCRQVRKWVVYKFSKIVSRDWRGGVQSNQKMHDLFTTKHISEMVLPDAFWAVFFFLNILGS